MINLTIVVGLIASLLVTVAYIPEVIRTVRSRHTRDISLSWVAILDAGQILYLVYGFYIASVPIILSSGLGALMTSILVAYKLRYKNK